MAQFDELPLDAEISGAGFDEQPLVETPKSLQPTSLAEEASRPFRTVGREIYEGGKAAFAPEYNQPNTFDKFLSNAVAFGAPSVAEASQKYISTPVSQVMGLLRALGSVPTAIGEEASILGQRVRGGLGMEQSPTQDLALQIAGAMATPAGMANLPLRAVTAASRATLRPAMRSVAQAERQGLENAMLNVRGAREAEAVGAEQAAAATATEARRAAAHANLARATADLDTATAKVAQRQGIAVTSPFATSLAAPVTNEQAFSFLKALKPGAVPSIPLKNLQQTAEDIIAQFEGIPKPLLPGKPLKTAQALAGTEEATQMLGGVPVSDLTAAQKSAWAPLLETIKSHNDLGGLSLDKLAQFKKSLGELTQVTGSATLGRRLYRGLMDDLRDSAKTNPGAAQALRANTIASQNLAARDIADAVTYNGTLVDKFGRLQIQANTLRKKLDADELLQQLPEAKRKEVVDTLEEIFRARKQVETATEEVAAAGKAVRKAKTPKYPQDLPEIISPTSPKGGFVTRTIGRGVGAATGGVLGAVTGVSYGGYAGAYAGAKLGAQGAEVLPQLIFQAVLKPGGTQFLKTLFADIPPMAGDLGKAAALTNFIQQSEQ